MFELYDFTFSHCSEKARWALDFKGVPYTPRYLTLPDRDRAVRFLCTDAPWLQRSLFALSFATIRRKMTEFMNINAASAQETEQLFLLAFDRLDNALERAPYLAGNRFSRADLTACALLWPLLHNGRVA